MFGLMNPGRQDTTFRRAYARCCQHQRRLHGLASLGFLSYESVLLYLFALDAGKLSPADLPRQTCCRLRSLPAHTPPAEREVARFCASVGLLLASIKMNDDIRDGGSLLARLANWVLRRRFREVFASFHRLDVRFTEHVEEFVAAHLALERTGKPIALEDYVRPTAEAFGHVFGLMARLPGLEGHETTLAQLGEQVGAAIIAFDCAADWHRDQRRGDFNPLPDGDESARAAIAFSQERLTQAIVQCRHTFGEESRVAHALCGVRQRIPQLCWRASACGQVRSSTENQLRRWGFVRRRGSFQVNTGWEVWAPLAALVAFGVGAVRWMFSTGPRASADEPLNLPTDVPGSDLPGGPIVVPPVSEEKKKAASELCGMCECCDGPCECVGESCGVDCGSSCAGDAAGGGDCCGGADCGGCDCNCS